MNSGLSLVRSFTLFLLSVSASVTLAQQAQNPNALLSSSTPKEDRSYASVAVAFNEFRSVDLVLARAENPESVVTNYFPLTGQTYGVYGTLGTYITEHFKTELRFGTGVVEDTLKETLEINMNYWLSWYIGGGMRITEYMSAYGLYGMSFYDADVTRHEEAIFFSDGTGLGSTVVVVPSETEMEEDLFGTKFSSSWILGLDFDITDEWFLAFEYGRLLRDTDTNIKVYQGGIQLRYEY